MNYNDYESNGVIRQKDLTLAPNEFCYVQNRTDGIVKTHTGPTAVTISQQETLVVFDSKSKQFKEVQNIESAKQLFVSAPENWYIILKNPAKDNIHPELSKPTLCNNLQVGEKINVRGPATFALFPGQMAKVVRGHSLRSNQYLLARVYEADAASTHKGEVLDGEGKPITKNETYVNGQLLVIKGTEVSFYIPPTGIEVIPVNGDPACGYVRDAVTLERLEYCILKDEDGNKRYVHGPEVVFPEPTETFVMSPKKNYIFRVIELSKISGIYAKVIEEYEDEDGTVHPIGEELFITGNDQMIYYPRPQHAIINYDDKIIHHAIAIPEGEGRYIMNRLTGEIKTVKGPAMYLPDPRTEVVVKRKLTPSQCRLWYPGNDDVLRHNEELTEKAVEKSLKNLGPLDELTAYMSSYNNGSTLANLEAKANISRGTSYTKPRTITLDNKYDGVVSLDVWTGYAVNVISKNGDRRVVCGPQTVMLDYDQTLEVLEMSTGRPKTTDKLIKTVFLRHENNKVSDLINIETKDFVRAEIKVSYCVSFDKEKMDKWFSVENYVKYLTDHERSLIKRAAKQYTIEEFYQNYADIVRDIAINKPDLGAKEASDSKPHKGREFTENGMYVYDVEVLSIKIEPEVEELLVEHQYEMVKKSLELSSAEEELKIARALGEAEEEKQKLRSQKIINKLELEAIEYQRKLDLEAKANRIKEAEQAAKHKAQQDLLPVITELHEAELKRKKAVADQEMAIQTDKDAQEIYKRDQLATIETAKQNAYASAVQNILTSISPDVAEALAATGHTELVNTIAKSISPYALANGESVADAINKLLRGTPIEGLVGTVDITPNN